MKWPLCWCDTGDDLTDKGDRVDPGVRLITWHIAPLRWNNPLAEKFFCRESTNMFRYCHFLRFGKQLFKLRSDRRVTLELGQYPLWYPSSDNEVATHQQQKQLIKWHLCVVSEKWPGWSATCSREFWGFVQMYSATYLIIVLKWVRKSLNTIIK